MAIVSGKEVVVVLRFRLPPDMQEAQAAGVFQSAVSVRTDALGFLTRITADVRNESLDAISPM